MSNDKVFLLDTHAICYRAFYAVRNLSNSKGKATNAVFGFCNILRKLLRDFKPKYMAACFDVARKTLRQEKFADYKIQRQAMPEDLKAQIPIIQDMLRAYSIPIFEMEGYEADDVMATLACRFSSQNTDIVIVSDDKDLCQLMNEKIHVYSPRLEKMLTQQDVQEKFGVSPSAIVDYLALAGDSSDNIPGVDGIGGVSAAKLINQHGSLDIIYKNIDMIKPPGLQEKLKAGKFQAYLSQELATVHKDLPLPVTMDNLKIGELQQEELHRIFDELEFKKLAQEYSVVNTSNVNVPSAPKEIIIDHEGQRTRVVYDLKSLRKAQDQSQENVFDLFIAQYLLSGSFNNPQVQAPATKEQFKEYYESLKQKIHEQGLDVLFYEIEMPLVDILFEMETKGVHLDLEVLKKLSVIGDKKLKETQESLYRLAGIEFNINSPKQLSDVLFNKLQLPVIKKTKTGFSTDEEVLTKLASKHPIPALILEYRQMAKLKSTYIDALPLMVDEKSRVHASFNQTGAETGRLSSNNPNLQNIPIRTDLGRQIRRAFIPYEAGHVLLSADYSQIELRLLAHCSKDANLINAFKADGDIHRYTASLMFETTEDRVDDKMRYAAKRINFGIIYGMSAFGLSKDLEVPQVQAQDFIDKYFLRYPKVRELMDYYIAQAQEKGYVETLFHRRRYLPEIKSANIGLRQFAQRQAINAPLQGSAADIIKLAMVKVCRAMKERKLYSTMIMTVHDELVFDVPLDERDQMVSLVRQNMEGVMELLVPLKASLKIGSNWLEMDSVDAS